MSKNLKHETAFSSLGVDLDKGYSESLLCWLSAGESAISALRVLSEQLPEMNHLLEENMKALSDSFTMLAGQVSDQSSNIKNVIEYASYIEINGEKKEMHDALQELSSSDDVDGDLAKIIEASSKRDVKLKVALDSSQVSLSNMLAAVSSGIVGMQFQDRVSQNLVIAENVSNEMMIYLAEIMDKTIADVHEDHLDDKIAIDKDFAKRIVAYFTLGELQKKFVGNLMSCGHLDDPAEIGVVSLESDDADEIELF